MGDFVLVAAVHSGHQERSGHIIMVFLGGGAQRQRAEPSTPPVAPCVHVSFSEVFPPEHSRAQWALYEPDMRA